MDESRGLLRSRRLRKERVTAGHGCVQGDLVTFCDEGLCVVTDYVVGCQPNKICCVIWAEQG